MLFVSCETEGQITGDIQEPEQDQYVNSDLDPVDGENLGHIGDLYFNLLSDVSYNREFWKWDYLDLQTASHGGGSLVLQTYNDSYYIPPDAFTENPDTVVMIYDENTDSYEIDTNFNNLDAITNEIPDPDLNTTLESITEQDIITISKNDWLGNTPASVEKWTWSLSEGLYSQEPMDFIVDEVSFNYEYDYDQLYNFVYLDTVLTAPLENVVIILDPNERNNEPRNYENYSVIEVDGEDVPVDIKREFTFYSYYNAMNKDFIFRESTDCNDNYQQDLAEKTYNDFKNSCNGIWNKNEQDYCSSTCDGESLYDQCWDEYKNEARLRGNCINSNDVKAFCDLSNNLLDNSEFLYDVDLDGEWSLMEIYQRMEPFEDRNCNGLYDDEIDEIIPNITNQNACDGFDYSSFDSIQNVCYYDKGNELYDDEESCKDLGALFGDCDYMDLYKQVTSPLNLLITYADQNFPEVMSQINPADVFKDCGSDQLCSKDEANYDPGTCFDNYSGSKEDCCKHNECWDYANDLCDFSLPNCNTNAQNYWFENLDPEGDDSLDEGNQTYDAGELILKDFGLTGYSGSDVWVSKYLNYDDCATAPCGGNSYEIFSTNYEVDTKIKKVGKFDSKVSLSSNKVIGQVPLTGNKINNLNIVKTEWDDSDAADFYAEDYMLFIESDAKDQYGMHNVIKMTQPFYFYANAGNLYTADIAPEDYNEDYWWQAIPWEQDTMLYSFDGEIIDGQTFHSSYMYELNGEDNEVATYSVHKEYEVSTADVDLEFGDIIDDCVLVTRTITISMIGPDQDIKIKSETYLKDIDIGPVIKEDISWSWPPLPGATRTFKKISAIEIKQNSLLNSNNSQFDTKVGIELNKIQDYPEFDFDPYRVTNTFGLQRFIGVPE